MQSSPIAEAIRYALKHWQGLTRFVDDGRIEIDSNTVERAIKPQVLTRKNALFAGSDGGGAHWAIAASLIETCKLGAIDPQAYLTDVLSRRTMMDRIEAALVTAAYEPVALFFVDLDGFKAVNDRLGHREGDALLVKVAQALQKSVRADDAVRRFGGDEFLVLAAVRGPSGARALALHMLEAVRQVSAELSGGGVSASIGYALAPGDAQHPLKLLQAADDAMYAAKRLGKDRVQHGPGRAELSPAAARPA